MHIGSDIKQGKLFSRLREVTGDAILRVAPPEGLPEGSLPVVGSAPNFSPKFSIPQGCLTKNFSPIGQEMTELLNGQHFEGRAAGKAAAPPRTAPRRSGDIATQSHPKI